MGCGKRKTPGRMDPTRGYFSPVRLGGGRSLGLDDVELWSCGRGWGDHDGRLLDVGVRQHQRGDRSLFDRDVVLAGVDADERSAVSDRAGEPADIAFVGLREGQVGVDVALAGLGLDREGGLLGDGDVDLAVAVLDGDVAERRGSGEVDLAVACGYRDVAGDALER